MAACAKRSSKFIKIVHSKQKGKPQIIEAASENVQDCRAEIYNTVTRSPCVLSHFLSLSPGVAVPPATILLMTWQG